MNKVKSRLVMVLLVWIFAISCQTTAKDSGSVDSACRTFSPIKSKDLYLEMTYKEVKEMFPNMEYKEIEYEMLEYYFSISDEVVGERNVRGYYVFGFKNNRLKNYSLAFDPKDISLDYLISLYPFEFTQSPKNELIYDYDDKDCNNRYYVWTVTPTIAIGSFYSLEGVPQVVELNVHHLEE